MNKTSCILFFVKYPTVGRTKTRLGKSIGNECACKLYRCFVDDLLCMLKDVSSEVIICFDPHNQSKEYQQWLGDDYKYLEQDGHDIGQRMSNSLQWAFDAGYSKAIVIGSDSPDLPAGFINEAFTGLNENNAVIGPSSDGGYYLIGFNTDSFAKQVFEGISWSSGDEFDETINIFSQKSDYSVYTLDTWYDIDIASDLKELLARNTNTEFSKTQTYEYAFEIVNRHT